LIFLGVSLQARASNQRRFFEWWRSSFRCLPRFLFDGGLTGIKVDPNQ
jgi:hypothetical protein